MHTIKPMPASAKLRLIAHSRCVQYTPSRFLYRSLRTATRPSPERPVFTRPSPKPHSSKQPSVGEPSPSVKPAEEPKFAPGLLSYHWDTLPPTPAQLSHSSKFFAIRPPKFLWSEEKFKHMDFGSSPEVCFLGRSNVGKSSLLNALLFRRVAFTSSKPGRTKLMNAFAVGGDEDNGKNRLVVLDMPGYGKGARAEWGTQILKYLEKRKQLKRAFLLVNAEHGLKETDRQLLALFNEMGIPFQVVLSKADTILFPGNRFPGKEALQARLDKLQNTMETVKQAIQPNLEDDSRVCGEIIACSSTKWIDGKRMGVEAVRFAMLRAAGLELRQNTKLAKPVEIVPHEELTWKPHSIEPNEWAETVPHEELTWKPQNTKPARLDVSRKTQRISSNKPVEIIPFEGLTWKPQSIKSAKPVEVVSHEKVTWRPQAASRPK